MFDELPRIKIAACERVDVVESATIVVRPHNPRWDELTAVYGKTLPGTGQTKTTIDFLA